MTFTDSIKTCFNKYADFNGRASLSEYWWLILFIFIVNALLYRMPFMSGIFALVMIVPTLAAGARRLHDTNQTGWLLLLYLVPVIGWLIVLVLLAQSAKEPNRFGPSPHSDSAPV
jgi:uncharacterized membrane protein YhaH (DUF805 family)